MGSLVVTHICNPNISKARWEIETEESLEIQRPFKAECGGHTFNHNTHHTLIYIHTPKEKKENRTWTVDTAQGLLPA